MDEPLYSVVEKRIQRTMKALQANNMEAYYVKTAAEVAPLVRQLAPAGSTVAAGGSMTLAQCGVMELLAGGEYYFLDRTGLQGEELQKLYRQVFSADCYFSSCNAVTEQGELYNVDGNANRVAALAFGPASVICVAGYNKIVPDLAAAEARVKAIAAPANAARLHCKTPCAVTGQCENCKSPARICCTTLVQAYQRIPGRVKVILVGESLGY